VPPEGHRRNKNEREKKKGRCPAQRSAVEKLSKNWSGSIYATPVWFRLSLSSSSRDKDTCFSLSPSLKKRREEERKEEEKRGDVFLKRLV